MDDRELKEWDESRLKYWLDQAANVVLWWSAAVLFGIMTGLEWWNIL